MDIKSLLFQAKMDGQGGRDLLEQSIKLSTWREAAFVLNYSEQGFSAFSLDEVIRAGGNLGHAIPQGTPLQDFLGQEYLDCEIGNIELLYEPRLRRLRWRSKEGEVVAVPFTIRNRIGINIHAPALGKRVPGIDRIIAAEEIYDHRMQVAPEDLLTPLRRVLASTPKQAQRKLALTYHPDRYQDLDELSRLILNRRMQEFNEVIRSHGEKKKGT